MLSIQFKTPFVIFLIPLVWALIYFWHRKQKTASLRFPSIHLVSGLRQTWKFRLRATPIILRIFAITLFIIALAGPRSVLEETIQNAEVVDIVLAIDASGSMAAEDFMLGGKRYNRLKVVKNVVNDFIDQRQYDRIGLIAFASLAYTVSPLTTDYSWLKTNLDRVQLKMIKDGTAIGSAINSSLIRLKNSKAVSKIVILLTDGMNNAGKVQPITAAKAAKALGIKIYTIGAGTKGMAPFPAKDIWGRTVYQNVQIDIDEASLKKIAEITGGEYFRATDTESLRKIYQQIDAMEKTEIEIYGYREYKQLFGYFLFAGLILLFIEKILISTVLMRLP